MEDFIIDAYTRKQAIEDGFQVKVDEKLSREAGIKFPVYFTSAVHSIVEQSVASKNNDFNGVMWDILSMMRFAIQSSRQNTGTLCFQVIITGVGRKKKHTFFAQCGPVDIDDPAPALTVMTEQDL